MLAGPTKGSIVSNLFLEEEKVDVPRNSCAYFEFIELFGTRCSDETDIVWKLSSQRSDFGEG